MHPAPSLTKAAQRFLCFGGFQSLLMNRPGDLSRQPARILGEVGLKRLVPRIEVRVGTQLRSLVAGPEVQFHSVERTAGFAPATAGLEDQRSAD